MNYNNIIILKDNVMYFNNQSEEFQFNFNKEILKSGVILDADNFTKTFIRFLKDNKLSTFFLNKKVAIIYDSLISNNDLKIIRNIFVELNYREVKLISDSSLLKLNKKDNYLITGNNYKLYYIDNLNIKKVLILDKNILSIKEMYMLIKNRSVNKNIFIIGNIFENNLLKDLNYYIYDSFSTFFFNLLNQEI